MHNRVHSSPNFAGKHAYQPQKPATHYGLGNVRAWLKDPRVTTGTNLYGLLFITGACTWRQTPEKVTPDGDYPWLLFLRRRWSKEHPEPLIPHSQWSRDAYCAPGAIQTLGSSGTH